jgi:hypothetical protein
LLNELFAIFKTFYLLNLKIEVTANKEILTQNQECNQDYSRSFKQLSCIIPEIIKANPDLNNTNEFKQAFSCLKTIQSIINDSQSDNQDYSLYRHCLDKKSNVYLFESAPKEALESTSPSTYKIDHSFNHEFLKLSVIIKVFDHSSELNQKNYLINYCLQLFSPQKEKPQLDSIQFILPKATLDIPNLIVTNQASLTVKLFPLDNKAIICFNTYSLNPDFHSRDIILENNDNVKEITEIVSTLDIPKTC